MTELIIVVCNFSNELIKALLRYEILKLTPLVTVTSINILPSCNKQIASSLQTDLVTESQTKREDEGESLFSQVFKRDITLHSCCTWLYCYYNEHKLSPHFTMCCKHTAIQSFGVTNTHTILT